MASKRLWVEWDTDPKWTNAELPCVGDTCVVTVSFINI